MCESLSCPTLQTKALEESGFGSIHTYDEVRSLFIHEGEVSIARHKVPNRDAYLTARWRFSKGHSHFYMPWSYLVALKDYKSKARWHRTAPELQIALRQRLHRTKSGRPVLRYFDEATMLSYQLPSRAQETTYCRQETGDNDEIPWDCVSALGFYPGHVHLPMEYLRVGKSGVGERAGRGLFAARDIPSHASIGVDKSVHGFHFPPLTWVVLDSIVKWSAEKENEFPSVGDEISSVYTYAEGVCRISSNPIHTFLFFLSHHQSTFNLD